MKVLLLVPGFAMGGADKFNLDWVTALSARGYKFVMCGTRYTNNPWVPLFEPYAETIHVLRGYIPVAEQPAFIANLIASHGLEGVFLSQSELGHRLLPFLRSRFPQVTFVDYTHLVEMHWRRGGYARLAVENQPLLDLNLVTSQQLKYWMVTRGGEPDRIDVCTINVDTELWNPTRVDAYAIRQTLGIPADRPMLLYAGRIVEQKRPAVFAEVMRRLACEERLSFSCVVAGDGPLLAFLETYVKAHGLQQWIQFVGAVSPERMQELQAAADIFFLPSAYEGISLALYEAMAMETVPVGADVGGQAELVTPECGYLIPVNPADARAYTNVLTTLIESPERRRAMAQASRQRVMSHFRLDQMATRLDELLHHAHTLSQTAPRPPMSRHWGDLSARRAIAAAKLVEAIETGQATRGLKWRHFAGVARDYALDVLQRPGYLWQKFQHWRTFAKYYD